MKNYATDVSPIVIDIETCGLPNAADFLEPVQPDARLKDPQKIADDIAEKEQKRQEKLGLDWNVGRIVAMGWWTEGGFLNIRTCDSKATEEVALMDFWDAFKHRTIVGFNIKGFDLRYMIQRSRYLGVNYPLLDLGKYSRKGIIDLYLDLTFNDGTYDQGAMRRTLKMFAKRFGIPVADALDGKDMPALIAAGEWAQVAAHCRSDVEITVALARKLGVLQPEVANADPEYYCGSDTRDLTGTPRSLEAAWWSAYRTAQRYGEGGGFLAWSRPQPKFAALVRDAERERQ